IKQTVITIEKAIGRMKRYLQLTTVIAAKQSANATRCRACAPKSLQEGHLAARPVSPRIDKTGRQRVRPQQTGPNTSGSTPALQNELISLSQEACRRPIGDRIGETQVCVLQQKAAERQQRLDKIQTLSCSASRDHGRAHDYCLVADSICISAQIGDWRSEPLFCAGSFNP